MKYSIVMFGDPVLRTPARPIDEITEDTRQLALDMLDTMYEAEGIGLAAQQIGKVISMCVIDIPPPGDTDADGERLNPHLQMPLVLINPTIVSASEERDSYDEGCLSFPGITGPVTRPMRISLKYQDLEGTWHEEEARGLVGRAMQHEIDHLHGVLFIDRMSAVKKIVLSGKLKRLKKKIAQEG